MSDTSTPAPFVPPRRRWLLRLAIAAGAHVALVALAWLVVPPVVRSQLESRLTEALGRSATVEAVAFDPFRLRVTVRKLAIADGDRPVPLFAFDELVADLSTASIWHRAPVLDALKLVHPAVSLSRDRDGRYNVQDLVDRAMSGPDGPPPRFSLNNIEIDDGVIAFDACAPISAPAKRPVGSSLRSPCLRRQSDTRSRFALALLSTANHFAPTVSVCPH